MKRDHPTPAAPSDLHVRQDYTQRAKAIVDRVMPRKATANIMEPANWIAVSRHDYAREKLFWRTFARLRAKAEGGVPYIAMPKGCDAVRGGAMHEVAHELAWEAMGRAAA